MHQVYTHIHTFTHTRAHAHTQPLGEHEYSRSSNPTRTAYEGALAAVENGRHGFAFASGLAALTTITQLLKPGDHIVRYGVIVCVCE